MASAQMWKLVDPMDFWQAYVVLISTAAFIWATKEVYEMITVRKLWQSIIEDPEKAGQVLGNGIFGLIVKLKKDKEAQEIFFDFLGVMSMKAASAAVYWAEHEMPEAMKKQAMKDVPKPLRGLIKAADALGFDIKRIGKDVAKEAGEVAAEKAASVWAE